MRRSCPGAKKKNPMAFGSVIFFPILLASNSSNQGGTLLPETSETVATSFKPSIAVIVGVLTTMFSLTFLLLIYAKHCKRNRAGVYGVDDLPAAAPAYVNDTGLERAVIEALPTFSFSSLQGQKDGLECAVCLCKYEPDENLRLLPKCKHAFHVNCVDTWLLARSTCPLCRNFVVPEDVLLVDEILAARRSLDEIDAAVARNSVDRSGLQIYVQREAEKEGPSNGRRDGLLLPDNMPSDSAPTPPHHTASVEEFNQTMKRFGHRIVISDVLLKHRWSDLVPSDVLFLNSQTLFWPSDRVSYSEGRHKTFKDLEMGSSRIGNKGWMSKSRSYSEKMSKNTPSAEGRASVFLKRAFSIGRSEREGVMLGRSPLGRSPGFFGEFPSLDRIGRKKDILCTRDQSKEDEETRKWLFIARGTLKWLIGREKKNVSKLPV